MNLDLNSAYLLLAVSSGFFFHTASLAVAYHADNRAVRQWFVQAKWIWPASCLSALIWVVFGVAFTLADPQGPVLAGRDLGTAYLFIVLMCLVTRKFDLHNRFVRRR